MTNIELFHSLCEKYDFKIMSETAIEGYAIPKSNRLHFSGYIIKYTEDNLYIANFPDIEDKTVYFCGQLTINNDLDKGNNIDINNNEGVISTLIIVGTILITMAVI